MIKIVATVLALFVLIAVIITLETRSTVNVSEEVSTALGGARVDCYEAGLDVWAGEREQVYECTFRRKHGKSSYTEERLCAAVMEGEVYTRPDGC